MRMTSHGDYLVQLTRFPGFFPVNCYFVREEDGLTLVDTGMFGSANAILAAAQQLEQPIRRIVLTHAHADHIGSLDALHKQLPDAAVLISTRDARFLAGDMRLDPNELQAKLRGSYQKVTTRPDRLLNDGDRVGSLRVVSAPGHTPGHIALFDTRDGSLIAGDALQTQGGVAVAGSVRWRFPFPALATWYPPIALASVRRLRTLMPTRLAVGHGDVFQQPLAAMDQAIAVAVRSFGEVVYHDA